MTRLGKLVVIGVLAGALAVVGCSDDTENGGAGGTGGTGGDEPPAACGGTPPVTVADGSEVAVGAVTCIDPIAGVVTVPIVVSLAAQPTGTLANGANDFDLQVVFRIEEADVGALGGFVTVAEIGESSGDVGSENDEALVNVPEAPVPCSVDFTADPDENGQAGPVEIVTPVTTGMFTVADDEVTLTLEEITFDIIAPVPLKLTTRDETGAGGAGGAGGGGPPCTWDEKPTLTFTVGAGGSGGSGG